LNNFQIFEYFLPKSLNKKFNYFEIGTYEGLSLLYVSNKYKNINVTGIDIVNFLNKKIKNHKNLKMFKSDLIIALRKLKQENQKFNYIYRWFT
jgi:predicted O-methyltransferase YrrM